MFSSKGDPIFTTQEACSYLRISRPTFLKYIYMGRIKAAKVGKGWKVLKSELDRFLKGENGNGHSVNISVSISKQEKMMEVVSGDRIRTQNGSSR